MPPTDLAPAPSFPIPAPVGPSGPPTADEQRRRLLDGMAEAIRQRGWAGVTVADVVREARTSRRTFYAHFSDRQDCLVALMTETNRRTIELVRAAVDPRASWRDQIRQAVAAWVAAVQRDPLLTLSWIRAVPLLGEETRHLQRSSIDAFVRLALALADTPAMRAEGLRRPSRELVIVLLGGLRELIATTVEDGGDVAAITEPAVEAIALMLGPRPPTSLP